MSIHELPPFELSADEMAEFHRIANIPGDDLQALVAAANIAAHEFEEFVREMGFEEDEACLRITDVLRRQAQTEPLSQVQTPQARQTIQDRVYSVLRDRLMHGGFEPGQTLKLAELTTALGTTVILVRKALNRLATERAIELMPSSIFRVPSLSRESLRDLMEARLAIEGLAVSRAAANMDEATLMKLHELIAAQSETDAEQVSEGSAERNREFYFVIYRRSGSAVLLPIIESLWLQFGPYLRVASEQFDGREGRGTDLRVEIVAALARGDALAARKALESDIGRSFDLLMTDNSFWREHGGAA